MRANFGMMASGIGMTSEGTRNRLVRRLREKGIHNQQVLDAIAGTPRHLFVDEALSSRAYEDSALPIGRGQTISQPFVVAMMSQALLGAHEKLGKVLEVGTGSGYQAAVLAPLAERVFTVERIGELVRLARQRFHRLGIKNVYTRHSDGNDGWPSQAPFDGIIVTAGGEITEGLKAQLAEGGRLVAPVTAGPFQELVCMTRKGDEFEVEKLGAVSFVPLLEGLE